MLGILISENEIFNLKENVPKKASLFRLKKTFLASISANTKGVKRCAVLFSGGLDSSLIAYAISKKIKDVKLYCVGLEGAKVFEKASKASALLNLELKNIVMKEQTVLGSIGRISEIIKSNDKLQLQIAKPLYFCMRQIKSDDITTVFSGQGADELFFGYDEFRRLLEKKEINYLDELRFYKLTNLYKNNLNRDLAIANHFLLDLRFPYLEKNFMLEALAFKPNENIFKNDLMRKRVLRRLAKLLGLPEELCLERKNAIQYGSGIAKLFSKAKISTKY
ncbi:MAG: asparagine synthase-related protein [Candidatus Diapherotrites archaeon]